LSHIGIWPAILRAPAAGGAFHSAEEQKWEQSGCQKNPSEICEHGFRVTSHAFSHADNALRWMNPLKLPPRQNMKKACDGSRITPVDRRISHRSKWQVKIKGKSQEKSGSGSQGCFPFGEESARLYDQTASQQERGYAAIPRKLRGLPISCEN